MRFKVQENTKTFIGELIYIKKEYSFDFQPMQVANNTILIRDINISFDYNNCATQVWGYNSFWGWEETKLAVPNSVSGRLILVDEVEDIERIKGSEKWKSYYDSTSGWVCVGDYSNYNDDKVVEFASNIMVVISTINEFKALWLKPTFK